jgi:hypothetical protein
MKTLKESILSKGYGGSGLPSMKFRGSSKLLKILKSMKTKRDGSTNSSWTVEVVNDVAGEIHQQLTDWFEEYASSKIPAADIDCRVGIYTRYDYRYSDKKIDLVMPGDDSDKYTYINIIRHSPWDEPGDTKIFVTRNAYYKPNPTDYTMWLPEDAIRMIKIFAEH